MLLRILDWLRQLFRKPTVPPLTGEEEIAENFDEPEVVFHRKLSSPRAIAPVDSIKRNVCLITIKFDDTTAVGPTNDQVWQAFRTGEKNVYDFYESMSYGSTFLTGQVFGPFTIKRGVSSDVCNHRDWIQQAKTKLASTGVDLTKFTNFAVFGPKSAACTYAGVASMSGNYLYMNGTASWATLAHELGHNFGLGHAKASNCPTGCPISTYGDPYDRMGNGQHGFQAQYRARIGVLTSENVRTVNSTGTYSLEGLEVPANGVKLLKVARGDGTFISISTRRAIGAYAPASQGTVGVFIHITNSIGTNSLLIDTHSSTTSRADAGLLMGEIWTDPLSKVRIKHVGRYDNHSRVGITIPA